MNLLNEEVKKWIGREVSYEASEEIGRASIRYFTEALKDDNRLYRDEDYARSAGYPGIIAPPTFVCETSQFTNRRPNSHGYAGHEWDLPIVDCRTVRVRNEYEFYRAALSTDKIRVTWRLDSLQEKSYSKGGTQLFVVSSARYFSWERELLALNIETIAYQPKT